MITIDALIKVQLWYLILCTVGVFMVSNGKPTKDDINWGLRMFGELQLFMLVALLLYR